MGWIFKGKKPGISSARPKLGPARKMLRSIANSPSVQYGNPQKWVLTRFQKKIKQCASIDVLCGKS
jgi:hypothetical protein